MNASIPTNLVRIIPILAAILLISCSGIRENSEPVQIRIGTYNVKNMFDGIDDPYKSDDSAISGERLAALSEVILDIDCDVLCLQEVENSEIFEEFNREYLAGFYEQVILIEGNDQRGIDVAVMSNVPIEDVRSYRDYIIPYEGHEGGLKFSRDLIAVTWIDPDGGKWTLLTTHLKSGGDVVSRLKRTEQARAIGKICRDENYVTGWGWGKLILAGDLNAEPWSDDLKALSSVPLSDPAKDLPYRYTHVSRKVLDYILLSPEADRNYAVGSVTIYREEPADIASDHYPVYVDLRF